MRAPLSSRPFTQQSGHRLTAAIALLGVLAATTGTATAQPASPTPTRSPEARETVTDLIGEASRRFGLPASWIAEVMQVESRGRANAVSPKGTIGLMQVMPETYAGIAARHGLGPDPWNPRDNIMAGAAYLREMFDRYGAAGMLAAYNAGPGRWEDHLSGARPLPEETIRYLGTLGPVVGGSVASLPAFTGRTVGRASTMPSIFVALNSSAAPVQGAAERERIARIILANATVIDRPAAIFVPRSGAAEAPLDPQPGAGGTTAAARADRSSKAARPSHNPLFPDRSITGFQP